MTRSNTVSSARPSFEPMDRSLQPTRALTISRPTESTSNTNTTNMRTENKRPLERRRQNSLPELPESEPLSMTMSNKTSPTPDAQIQTPPSRIKSLAATELYDDYYNSAGAYDEEEIPELPPIGGKKIEAWANKTSNAYAISNALNPPPSSMMTRQASLNSRRSGGRTGGLTSMRSGSLSSGNGSIRRNPSFNNRSVAAGGVAGGGGGGLGRTPSFMDGSRYEDESEAGSMFETISKVRVKVCFGGLSSPSSPESPQRSRIPSHHPLSLLSQLT